MLQRPNVHDGVVRQIQRVKLRTAGERAQIRNAVVAQLKLPQPPERLQLLDVPYLVVAREEDGQVLKRRKVLQGLQVVVVHVQRGHVVLAHNRLDHILVKLVGLVLNLTIQKLLAGLTRLFGLHQLYF